MYIFDLPDKELKRAAKLIKQENRHYSDKLEKVSKEKWEKYFQSQGSKVLAVYRSKKFLVQVHDEKGRNRISINRTEIDTTNKRWKDGISWDEIQKIKSEIGYGDRDAVEVFPRDCDVVNVANIRHIWIVGKLSFVWRKTREIEG